MKFDIKNWFSWISNSIGWFTIHIQWNSINYLPENYVIFTIYVHTQGMSKAIHVHVHVRVHMYAWNETCTCTHGMRGVHVHRERVKLCMYIYTHESHTCIHVHTLGTSKSHTCTCIHREWVTRYLPLLQMNCLLIFYLLPHFHQFDGKVCLSD